MEHAHGHFIPRKRNYCLDAVTKKPASNPAVVDLEQGCGNPVIEGRNPAGFSENRVESLVPLAQANAVFCLGGQKTWIAALNNWVSTSLL